MKRLLVVLTLFLLVGCAREVPASLEQTMSNNTFAVVETNKGTFTIELYSDTPISKANFVQLVESGFYDGLTFHRYEPGFVIQGGDPKGDGTGGSDKTISLEIAPGKSHSRGTLGMARSQDPNSASSQWFVNLADNTFLDGGYAVFGKVTDGIDVVDQLRAGDKMNSVRIVRQ